MEHEHDDEGYAGPAEITVDGRTLALNVRLGGHFQPLDGYYHWYGRLDASDELSALVDAGQPALLATPHGSAAGRLSDPDLWGRYRIEGTSTPPFRVHRTLDEVEHVL